MKKFLPVEHITYKTPLAPEEVAGRLIRNVSPKRSRIDKIYSGGSETYEGFVGNNSFEISRIISYRNSFLPVIKGTIERDVVGTKIHVSMRMNPGVEIFAIVWCGAVGLASVIALFVALKNKQFEVASLGPLGMLLAGYGLVFGSFKYESSQSKEFLRTLFESWTIDTSVP